MMETLRSNNLTKVRNWINRNETIVLWFTPFWLSHCDFYFYYIYTYLLVPWLAILLDWRIQTCSGLSLCWITKAGRVAGSHSAELPNPDVWRLQFLLFTQFSSLYSVYDSKSVISAVVWVIYSEIFASVSNCSWFTRAVATSSLIFVGVIK